MSDVRQVLIAGAGPAGSALAYFLAGAGMDVLLVDKASFPRDKTCGDGLTPRALGVVRSMGLLDTLQATGFQANRVRLVAPNGRNLVISVLPYGDLPQFLLILPRYRLDDLLRAHAVKAGAEFRPRVKVLDVLREAGRVVGLTAMTPRGPTQLRAGVTVLATGASLSVLRQANMLPRRVAFGRAARTYFENVRGLSDCIEFHFASTRAPTYGWVFPISSTAANVGAFTIDGAGSVQDAVPTPRQAFDEFVASPELARRLVNASPTGPVKGYPLRLDFPTAQTALPGLMLVGEACGLVNPVTGEGIDYALESAELAAEVLIRSTRTGDSPEQAAERYSTTLRDRFLRGFVSLSRFRDRFYRPWMLDKYWVAAKHDPDLAEVLYHVASGNIDPTQGYTPKVMLRAAYRLLAHRSGEWLLQHG